MLQMSREWAIATEWQALVEDACSGVLSLEARLHPYLMGRNRCASRSQRLASCWASATTELGPARVSRRILA